MFPPILNDNLVGYRILGCGFLAFITLKISCPFLLSPKVAAEKSADTID